MEELASLGFISVIPAILAIVLSFATKNTIVALAIACITGTTLTGLAQGTNLLETLLLGHAAEHLHRHPSGLFPKDRRHPGFLPMGP